MITQLSAGELTVTPGYGATVTPAPVAKMKFAKAGKAYPSWLPSGEEAAYDAAVAAGQSYTPVAQFITNEQSPAPSNQATESSSDSSSMMNLDTKSIAMIVGGGLLVGYGAYKGLNLTGVPSAGLGLATSAVIAYFTMNNNQLSGCCY